VTADLHCDFWLAAPAPLLGASAPVPGPAFPFSFACPLPSPPRPSAWAWAPELLPLRPPSPFLVLPLEAGDPTFCPGRGIPLLLRPNGRLPRALLAFLGGTSSSGPALADHRWHPPTAATPNLLPRLLGCRGLLACWACAAEPESGSGVWVWVWGSGWPCGGGPGGSGARGLGGVARERACREAAGLQLHRTWVGVERS